MNLHIQKYYLLYLYFLVLVGTIIFCYMPSLLNKPATSHGFWFAGESIIAGLFFMVLYKKETAITPEPIMGNQFGELSMWMLIISGFFCLVGTAQEFHAFAVEHLFP
jgi:hypothetical protein